MTRHLKVVDPAEVPEPEIRLPISHVAHAGRWHYLHPGVDLLLCGQPIDDMDAIYSDNESVTCRDCSTAVDVARHVLESAHESAHLLRTAAGGYLLAAHMIDSQEPSE